MADTPPSDLDPDRVGADASGPRPRLASTMSPRDVVHELCRLAARLGVVVRIEPFDPRLLEGRGGLCWLRGVPTVLVDEGLSPFDKVGVLAEALAVFDVEALYLPPAVRQRLRAAG